MRKHNYVVGFKGEGEVAYGKNMKMGDHSIRQWADPLTILQDKRMKKSIVDSNNYVRHRHKVCIYKLVEVKP